jgi:hypothetical protein
MKMDLIDRNLRWKMGNRKGQAVMEYLITYGLALFVILIVLAILVAVVLPSLQAPETCQFTQPGFSCNQNPHTLVADSGNNVRLLFELANTQGKAVSVKGAICTTSPPGNLQKSDIELNGLFSSPIVMASGQSITLGGPNSDVTSEVTCYNQDGTTTTLSPNSNFKGSIGILYRFTEDHPDAPDRIAVATVTGNVQSE